MAIRSLREFLEAFGIEVDDELPEFTPCVRYFPMFGSLVYLSEECSYRASRVSESMTVLLHPYEERVIGLQLHDTLPLLR